MHFISFSCLMIPASTSSDMQNTSGERRHACPIPDFRGKAFRFSPLSIMLTVRLFYMALFCWGTFCLCQIRWKFCFTTSRCRILSDAFFAFIGIITFLPIILLMCYITLIDLLMLNHPGITEINPTSLWHMILLMYSWIHCAIFSWRFSASIFIRHNGL